MSYRDLRNFSESMRALGFPEPVSVESFRVPNWPLLVACVRFLGVRLEPDAALPAQYDTVPQRVQLIAQAAQLFHSRANLKLSGPRLYGADGWAVRELLKVASLLRAAITAPSTEPAMQRAHLTYDITNRLGEIKQARSLATDITAQGALLYDLLANEAHNKEKRDVAVSRPLDLSSMESTIRRALSALQAKTEAARERREAAEAGAAALDDKIQRRRQELQRAEARLHTVQKIRPAYQGELSALESELSVLWEQYVLRYRTVEALKHQLSLIETKNQQAVEEQQAAILQLIHKYEAEDVLHKLSDTDENSSSEDNQPPETKPRPATRPKTRLRIKTAGGANERVPFGNMAAEARDSLDDIRADDDSNTDTDLTDDHYGRGAAGGWSRPRPRPATRTLVPADDDDDLLSNNAAAGGATAVDSLGSSSESELRLTSGRINATRLSHSDDEF